MNIELNVFLSLCINLETWSGAKCFFFFFFSLKIINLLNYLDSIYFMKLSFYFLFYLKPIFHIHSLKKKISKT
jgi:hypothetical protein